MKKYILFLFTCLVTMLISLNSFSQSVDTFYIDKTGAGNYTTITAAVNVLKTANITKPRVYIIKAGTYTENIVIPALSGTSNSNYVVFKGVNKDSVVIKSSTNATIEFNGADFITFENVNIVSQGNACFWVHNSSDYITITKCILNADTNANDNTKNCIIISSSLTAFSTGLNAKEVIIMDNYISGGFCAVLLYGKSETEQLKATVKNNTIEKYYDGGIVMRFCNNNLIENNRIKKTKSTAKYGITNSMCKHSQIIGNIIDQCNMYGIYFYGENDFTKAVPDSSYVINNIIIPDLNNKVYSRGIYMFLCRKIFIFHNSVWINHSNSNGGPIRISECDTIQVFNNIFALSGNSGYVFDTQNPVAFQSDYNDYYYPAAIVNPFSINVSTSTDFNGFKNKVWGYTHDQHSYNNSNPNFVSANDLHIKKTSIPLEGSSKNVDFDVDGDLRCSSNVSIGADENRGSALDAKMKITGTLCINNYIQFQSTSTGQTQYHKWLLNGITASTNAVYNHYSYAATTDTITLIEENKCDKDSVTKVITIEAPKADFKVDISNPMVNRDTIEFTNLAGCNPPFINWDIQPATFSKISGYPSTSNPKIVFKDTGCYTIRLVIGRGIYYDTLVKSCYIHVKDSLTISLNGANPLNRQVCFTYRDAGAVCNSFSGHTYPVKYDSSFYSFTNPGTLKWKFLVINPTTLDSIISYRIINLTPDTIPPKLQLLGKEIDTIEVFSTFSDPGFTFSDSCGIMTDSITGNVNINLIGKNILKYFATDINGNSDMIERVVYVLDIDPPTLTLLKSVDTVEVFNSYISPGCKVLDNYCTLKDIKLYTNGTIDTSKLGVNYIDYWSEDCNGNFSDTLTQSVFVLDQTPPILTWTGSDTLYLERYKSLATHFDTFLHVNENYDKNLTVTKDGTYFTTYLNSMGDGCYSIHFRATDMSGNISNEIKVWVCIIPSSVTDELANLIRIYPNPSIGTFVVEFLGFPVQSIRVINAQGQLVYASVGKIEALHQISLNKTAGLYYILLQTENRMITRKLIIE